MTRRTMAERKQRAADRQTRRDALLVLLSRIARGIPVTAAEAALLRAHVEVELTEADELRRTVAGQQTALQAAHDRTAAADAAIVEAEQRAEQAEHKADRYRTAWLAARRDRKADRAAMAADLPDTQAGRQARETAEDSERLLAALEEQAEATPHQQEQHA